MTGPNGGRYYIVDEAAGTAYPSVTTITGAMLSKESLNEWRKAVGEEKAALITQAAADRGTFMHSMHEHTLDLRFVKGQKDGVLKAAYPLALADCKSLSESAIEKGRNLFFRFYGTDFYERIASVEMQETPVWSKLGGGYAGRLDLMVKDHDGKRVLVDFKSSTKPKRKEWIAGYELQAAAYSAAFREQFGEFPDRAEIWIACESGEVQEFPLNRSELIERLRQFHSMVTEYHKRNTKP